MAYSIQEIEDLKSRIEATLSSGHLDAWQTKFLFDIKARIERYETKTRLSDKQQQKIREILGGEKQAGFSTGRRSFSRPNVYPLRRRRGRGFIAREGRWWARRFVRDFAIAAAFFAVFGAYYLIEKGSLPGVGSVSTIRGDETTGVNPGANTEHRSNPSPRFTVTDGDTIRIFGERKGTRLIGFNTPETFRPGCAKELELGKRATARLKELVAASSVEIEKVPCACKPGTQGTDACNFGRSCGKLRVDGRDVGQILISEGLAAPFSCGPTSCPPLPRPWCN